MDYIDISVPTKPYIKRYMEVNYGSPISVTRADNVGCLLFLLLEREPHEVDKKVAMYPVNMDIRLSSQFYHRKGTSLTNTSITWLNNFIEESIKSIMGVYIQTVLKKKSVNKKSHAIYSFMDEFSFRPEDFPYETAKKHIDRHHKDLTGYHSEH